MKRLLHILAAIVGVGLVASFSGPGRAPEGATIGGISIAGARSLVEIDKKLTAVNRRPLVITAGQTYKVTPQEIGLRLDVQRAAARGYLRWTGANYIQAILDRRSGAEPLPVIVDNKERLAAFVRRVAGAQRAIHTGNGWSLVATTEPELQALIIGALSYGRSRVVLRTQSVNLRRVLTVVHDLKGRSAGSIHNARLGNSFLNGAYLPAGKLADFDQLIGPRTTERGFVPAPAIVGDGIDLFSVGGGACVGATSVFRSSVMLHARIVERHPHSRRPSKYAGIDATIAAGHKNLRFIPTVPMLLKAEFKGTRSTVTVYSTAEPSPVRVEGPFRVGSRARYVTYRRARNGKWERLFSSTYKVQ